MQNPGGRGVVALAETEDVSGFIDGGIVWLDPGVHASPRVFQYLLKVRLPFSGIGYFSIHCRNGNGRRESGIVRDVLQRLCFCNRV